MKTLYSDIITAICIVVMVVSVSVRYGLAEELISENEVPLLSELLNVSEKKRSLSRSLSYKAAIPQDRTGDWVVDTGNRQLTRSFYNIIHNASSGISDGWTGDIGSCSPGTTSADFQNGVLARVNYFRAMAGVPSDISFSNGYSTKAQQAALMISRNDWVSHYPASSWDCYTPGGAEAAARSSLFQGIYGPDAVSALVRDNGSYNGGVTNRRAVLYPQTRSMGTGNIPSSPGYSAAHALWVYDDKYGTARPATREFYVAWPPPGYVPYSVVPARWSFSYDADFTNASVSMTSNGAVIPVFVHPVQTGYGENTISWDIVGIDADDFYTRWPAPAADSTYTVFISNMEIGGVMYTFSYDVTVIDPSVPGDHEEFPTISGPDNPETGIVETYMFNAVSFAEGYEVLVALFTEGGYFEGGENGLTAVIDNSDPSYDLLASLTSMSGNYALHLAHPAAETESFELDRRFVPSALSTLEFGSRLGYATVEQSFQVQISVDDSQSWTTIYHENGTDGAGQSDFISRSLSLAEYADSLIRIRFVYKRDNGGSYFYCTEDNCGVLIDDIQITAVKELNDTGILPLGESRAFTFKSPDENQYLFAVRVIPWNGYPGMNWGPVRIVQSVPNKVELMDAVRMMNTLSSGLNYYTLAEIIGTLGVLTGKQ